MSPRRCGKALACAATIVGTLALAGPARSGASNTMPAWSAMPASNTMPATNTMPAWSATSDWTTSNNWSAGACSSSSGVSVAVDFRSLGDGIHLRCAPGAVTSGFDALTQAGIAYDTAIRSPGFLCRIAGKPASDPCIDTSPASAHWSYWLAERGGQWCYSNLGAGNRRPPAGTVEGWSFSEGSGAASARPPGIEPPPALPGSGALAATDCDRSPDAPGPTPTTAAAPPTTAPTEVTTPPAGPGGTAGGTAGSSPAFDPGAAPTDPATQEAAGSPTESVGGGSTDGSSGSPSEPTGTAPTSGAGSTETTTAPAAQVAGASQERGDPSAEGGRGERAAAGIELSDRGHRGGTGPLGTGIALGTATALGAGAVVVRRRRNTVSTIAEDRLP